MSPFMFVYNYNRAGISLHSRAQFVQGQRKSRHPNGFLVPISLDSVLQSAAKVSRAANAIARTVDSETVKRQRSLHVRLLDGCGSR
jgi:hypothetical protein